MNKKKAMITGITGQDGSYLAELLLEKGYQVYGLVRQVVLEDPQHRLKHILPILDHIELVPGFLESFPSVYKAVAAVQPDEVYHLAAQSFVSYNFEDEFSTIDSNIHSTHYVLSAIREAVPQARFYFAASSEMFGTVQEVPQRETTAFHPRSAYGISKVAGFYLTQNYRESHHMFACSGILYNHESPRRGFEFVTRKITSHAAKIKLGLADRVELGNLDAKRNWGHAKDYVRAMWMMLQQDKPDDYIICTTEVHSVRDFCQQAFAAVGLDYEQHVVVNPKFFRPAETHILTGDSAKATHQLGWQPTIPFNALVEEMVLHDLHLLSSKMQ
ncbi:MAG: GDP-mannose 4,6-dehydratase [Magnetococcales bacterium]|nr:GDP-mannose 4,6-dehydratase [Magnetococcales bacterium]